MLTAGLGDAVSGKMNVRWRADFCLFHVGRAIPDRTPWAKMLRQIATLNAFAQDEEDARDHDVFLLRRPSPAGPSAAFRARGKFSRPSPDGLGASATDMVIIVRALQSTRARQSYWDPANAQYTADLHFS